MLTEDPVSKSNPIRKFTSIAERTTAMFGALAAVVYLVSGLVYLCLGYWPVTHRDYWRLYQFYLNHTWLESSLYKYSEHLMFFPSFFCLADLRFFHGNQEPLFIAGLALLLLTVALLLIPVWLDQTVTPTAKIMATLVVIAGNFWMARSPIIASGGFSCICSLLMASAVSAFLLLPGMGVSSVRRLTVTVLVLGAGFVASFSFGIGLAIWPTLFFLVWALRLPWQCFVSVGAAAVVTIVLHQQSPPHLAAHGIIQAVGSAGAGLITALCRLAGNPFFYAASGWHHKPLSSDAARSSMLSLWCGATGLALAVVAIAFAIIRRDLNRSSLKRIGIALVTFNLVAMSLIVAGNRLRGPRAEFEFLVPRYLFWTTLFWIGLVLIIIQWAETRHRLRWCVYLAALVLPVAALPQHYRSALNCRWARVLAESGAITLVNGVRDDPQIRILAPLRGIDQVYRLAEQLRARRLDMFADGLQDWLGLSETNITGGRYTRVGLRGQCKVASLIPSDNGTFAARVTGQVWKSRRRVPETLVIIDPAGVIRGIGHASSLFSENKFLNSVFYLRKVKESRFIGYIRDYDPQLQYAVRSADNGSLSEETVPVKSPVTKSTNP